MPKFTVARLICELAACSARRILPSLLLAHPGQPTHNPKQG